ncbi:MAG: hypothetical protein IJW76_01850 [Clostridia bacterium]|nr:hypothetical protein [Clostridia bacterium]
MKGFCFTVDDNIWCLKELSQGNYESIFSHPYLAVYKRLHERFGVKVQLNLFYEENGFDLSQMTARFRVEWEDNADWLKLSYHALHHDITSYENVTYKTMYEECAKTNREIIRFAGEASLAKSTTIHFCKCSGEGISALKECGYEGLLGLYGTQEQLRISYGLSEEACKRLQGGELLKVNGVWHLGIDIVLNRFCTQEILKMLDALKTHEVVSVMIHEQFFYPHYRSYQADFEEKLAKTFEKLLTFGYESRFAEEIFLNK